MNLRVCYVNKKSTPPGRQSQRHGNCGLHSARAGGAIMKDALDSMPTERTLEQEKFCEPQADSPIPHSQRSQSQSRKSHGVSSRMWIGPTALRRQENSSAEQTNAENFYYQKQMQSKTPMVVVLRDGEELHGTIEWYDRSRPKLICPNGQSNVLVYKPAIKYMFKEGEKS